MNSRIIAALLILASCLTPLNPSPTYMDTVIAVCADIYGLNSWDTCRIMQQRSGWSPNMPGDNGRPAGVWQWKEKSITAALSDMDIVWDWGDGDPRLNVWASTLAACHSLAKGWDWWTTRESCEGVGR